MTRFLLLTVACLCWSGQTPARAVDQVPAKPALTASNLWLVPSPEQVNARATIAHAVAELSTGTASRLFRSLRRRHPTPCSAAMRCCSWARAACARAHERRHVHRSTVAVGHARAVARARRRGVQLAADAAETASDWSGAIKTLQDYLAVKPTRSASLLLRLGHAAVLAGERSLAVQSYSRDLLRIRAEPEARDAETEVIRIRPAALAVTTDTYTPELGRAERLFAARRYSDARRSFYLLRPLSNGEDRSQSTFDWPRPTFT